MGKNDGGFSVHEPSKAGTGKNDGGFQVYNAGKAASPGNNGGFRTYQKPDPGAPAKTELPPVAAAASSKAPEALAVVRSLTVAWGAKASLRSSLERTLAAVAAFCLAFFDALVTETETPGQELSPQEPTTTSVAKPEYEAYGFILQEDDGAILVAGLLGGSPAEAAGLKVGDQIVAVDDGIKPTSIASFTEAWKRGAKWSSYKL